MVYVVWKGIWIIYLQNIYFYSYETWSFRKRILLGMLRLRTVQDNWMVGQRLDQAEQNNVGEVWWIRDEVKI